MAKRENITTKFDSIETYIVDQSSTHTILGLLSDLKLKGRTLEKEVVKNIKNIVNRALAEVDETTQIEIFWGDFYESAKMVKFKCILNQEFCKENGELKIIADHLLKSLKVKQVLYGLYDQRPALIIWM